MAKILQTDASLWKEKKTLSFSGTYSKHYDTVWTDRLSDGSWPTFLISDTAVPECRLVLSTSISKAPNTLHLPSIHETFAHLSPWDGSVEHAVNLLAELLCYRVVTEEAGPPLWLITSYEKETLARNLENPLIDKIILLNKEPCYSNVEERIVKNLTYAHIIETIKTFPPNVLVAFAHSDIFFDSWKDLWTLNLENVCLALRAYELPPSGDMENPELREPFAEFQDTWVVRAEDVQKLDIADFVDIPFGASKADSVFALRMLQKKFLIVNPARSLVTWHRRQRTITKEDIVKSPMYHHIHPTGLNERKPLLRLTSKKEVREISVRGPDAAGWVHRLSKKGISKILGTTTVTVDVPDVFVVKNCFQTPTGLAFDANTMYIGSCPGAQERWSQDPLYPMLPTEQCELGLVAPLPVDTSQESFLHYFAKLLLLKASAPAEAVYICPAEKGFASLFGLTVKHPSDYIVYKEAYCLPVSNEWSRAEVAAIRSTHWTPAIRTTGYPTIVLMEDAGLAYEEPLRRGYDVKVVYPGMQIEKLIAFFLGASAVVCTSKPASHAWNWLLPKGAHVIEVSSTSTSAHHLSTVSDLHHIFTTVDGVLDTIAKNVPG
jgi:hypothetical protein